MDTSEGAETARAVPAPANTVNTPNDWNANLSMWDLCEMLQVMTNLPPTNAVSNSRFPTTSSGSPFRTQAPLRQDTMRARHGFLSFTVFTFENANESRAALVFDISDSQDCASRNHSGFSWENNALPTFENMNELCAALVFDISDSQRCNCAWRNHRFFSRENIVVGKSKALPAARISSVTDDECISPMCSGSKWFDAGVRTTGASWAWEPSSAASSQLSYEESDLSASFLSLAPKQQTRYAHRGLTRIRHHVAPSKKTEAGRWGS
jgi:hypothetical protein